MSRFLTLTAALFTALPAHAQERHALVMGISDYVELAPLERADADARAIHQALREAGYQATLSLDPGASGFGEAVRKLAEDAAPGDELVFYYTGRAVSEGGETYLLAADMPPDASTEALRSQASPLSDTLELFDGKNLRFSLVIVDAHHDNPFPERVATDHLSASLSPPPESDSLVLYSAGGARPAPTRWSRYDDGDLSPFARAALEVLQVQDVSLDDALRHLRYGYQSKAFQQGVDIVTALHGEVPDAPINLTGDMGAPTEGIEAKACSDALPDLWSYYRTYGESWNISLSSDGPPCQATQTLIDVANEKLGTADHGGPMPFDYRRLRSDLELPKEPPRALKDCITRAHPDILLDDQLNAFALDPIVEICARAVEDEPDSPLANALYGRILTLSGRASSAPSYLTRAAEAGDSTAMVVLGDLHLDGRGRAQDYFSAVNWYQKAAAAGDWAGMSRLARMYRDGLGVDQDDSQAVALLEKARNPEANVLLGLMHLQGRGVAQDSNRALGLFRKAALDGSPAGMFYYASALDRSGSEAGRREALNWFFRAARLGDGAAMEELSRKYRLGDGVAQNPAEAGRWLDRAAAAGRRPVAQTLDAPDAAEPPQETKTAAAGPARQEQSDAVQQEQIDRRVAAAEAGDVAAMLELADMHLAGRRVPVSAEAARDWLTRAADQGSAEAMARLGELYLEGGTLERDAQRARAWLRRGAEAGSPPAMAGLARIYAEGLGVAVDPQEAFDWRRRAARAGYVPAMTETGRAYLNGAGIAQDDGAAFEWFEKAASAEDPDGMFELARLHEQGWGTPENLEKAFAWYKQAGLAGHIGAMMQTGFAYRDGRGTDQNDQVATVWFRKAAEAGSAAGMYELGSMYDAGRGIAEMPERAVEWYLMAADAGEPRAMHRLGLAHKLGRGAPQDDALAVAWFSKAADSGLADAKLDLGWMYERGRGVEQDKDHGADLYFEAAEDGNLMAMDNLGLMYAQGSGVPQSDVVALHWFTRAADGGFARAMLHLGGYYEGGSGREPEPAQSALWYLRGVAAGDDWLLAHVADRRVEVRAEMQKLLAQGGHYDGPQSGEMTQELQSAVEALLGSGRSFRGEAK